MGDVISLRRFQGMQQDRKQQASTKQLQQQYDEIMQYVSGDWELHYRRGTLNAHFKSLLNEDFGDVLALDNIKKMERALSIRPVIFAPNSIPMENQDGWVAGFAYQNINYATPPMITEAHARAFSILLYIELTNNTKEGAL